MEGTAIVKKDSLTIDEVRAQVNLIQQVMREIMQEGTHYGIIPGCGDKPTLYKAGAEKLLSTFRLSAEPVITDLSNDDEIRYRVAVQLSNIYGEFLGTGVGECSSNEEKYRWRKAICDEEWYETHENRRREKWYKGYKGNDNYKVKQVRTNIADVANTVLKIGKKRGLVDVTLTVTAASDIFTQDMEDIPEEILNGHSKTVSSKKTPSSTPPPNQQSYTNGVNLNPFESIDDFKKVSIARKIGVLENLYKKATDERRTLFSKQHPTLIKNMKEQELIAAYLFIKTDVPPNVFLEKLPKEIDESLIQEYLNQAATGNKCTIEEIKEAALDDWDQFMKQYEVWCKTPKPTRSRPAGKVATEKPNVPVPPPPAGVQEKETIWCPKYNADILLHRCTMCGERVGCPAHPNESTE